MARTLVVDARFAWQTRVLPRRVALLALRAQARARRTGDAFSLASATRPADLARILRLAAGRRDVVELGTGTAWTAVALAADMLYIDSSHEGGDVIAEYRAWEPVLSPGSVVVLDDYGHPQYPGVAEAVAELGLAGRPEGTLSVHVHSAPAPTG